MNEVKYDVDALDSVDWQDVRFVDIFDISEIQHMQDLFADAHGVASLITDIEGNPITRPSNFTNFCAKIIRNTEIGCANCFKSDAALGRYNPNTANVQQCLSGSLWDAGASITVGGKHIANWLIGQVRNEDIDVEKLMQYANLIGADSDAYKAAFEKVPVMSTEKFTKVANLLFLIANELSEKAYSNILLRKQIGKNEIAHKALKESEERFQLLFNKAPLGYQSLDINACFIDVNQKWLDTLGYEREEVVGKWFGDFMPPKYQDIVKVNFPKFLAQGHIHVELEMLHKNGSTLFVAIDGKIGTDSDGNFKQTHCILQDITESKRTLDALKASEEKHRTILQTAMDGFWLVDLNGNLLEVNDAYCKMSGYSEDELLKMNIDDLDIVENEDITKEHIHKVKTYGHDRFETKHRRKDGSAIDVEITVKLFGADMLVVFLRDITTQNIAKQALTDAEWKFKALFELGPIGVAYHRMIYDENGAPFDYYFIDANASYNQLTGVSPKGMTVRQAFPGIENDPFDWIGNFGRVAKTGETFRFEQLLQSNGRWYDCVAYQYMPDHFVAAFTEITQRKEAEALLEKQKLSLSSIIEGTNVGTWEWNVQTGETIFNERWAEIEGYTLDEIMPVSIETWKKFAHPDDVIIATEKLNKHFAGELDYFEIETRMKHKNGEWVWILDRGKVHTWTADGKPLMMSGTHLDITERKKAEMIIENQRALYLDLVNTQPAGIYRIRVFPKDKWESDAWENADTPPYKMELISERFCEILEIDAHVFETHPGIIIEMVHPDDKEAFVRLNDKANTLVKAFSFDCRLLVNGRIKWIHFESLPRKIENGDILYTGIIYDITEQKIAESKIKESEAKYRLLAENAKDVIWVLNLTHAKYTFISQSIFELRGLSVEEAMCEPMHDSLIGESYDLVNKVVAKNVALLIESPLLSIDEIVEVQQPCKDGSIIWVEISTRMMFNENNEIEVVGVSRNITERKKAEDALRESEERFRATFEQAAVGISQVGLDGRWLRVNQRLCDIVGYERDTLLTLSFQDITHKDDLQNDLNNLQLLLAGKIQNYAIEKRYIRKNGSTVWVNLTVGLVRDTLAKPKYFVSVIEDITHKKMAENALRESEEKLSKLFNTMTEIVVMHELVFDENQQPIDYRILDCNPAFSKYTGIEKENAVGMLATELYSSNIPPYLETYASVALNESSLDFRTYYQPLDKYFLISVVSTRKNRFSTITTDITASEKMHRFIEEKNKELENYIYVASHDLRSPLVNIQGFSQRLQKQSSQLALAFELMNERSESANLAKSIVNTEMPKSLDFILNNVSKMDMLIGGLLQVSRTGRLALQPALVDMNALMATLLRGFDYQLNDFGANVELKMLDACFGDANQLNQLFSNIISNAIKYRDSSRSLKIAVASSVKYNKVVYSISDNGIGISEKQLPKIWDIFYRVNNNVEAPGEGLGLSIAKQIVDKHKGRIWAESVEGSGTTFFVELLRENFLE